MTPNLQESPSVAAEIGQITPEMINPQLLLDIVKMIEPVISEKIPQKRSGFSYSVFAIFMCCIQILRLSPLHTAEKIHTKCLEQNVSFQSYSAANFSNKKQRRYFPDQPSLSRCLKKLSEMELIEDFWNSVLLAHFLVLKSLKIISTDLKLIADYTDTPCKKDKQDPFCFGKKEGKTVHRTLSFSIISGELHQMLANYKIKKQQDKLPIFEGVVSRLENCGCSIKYALLDRGFYRKRILKFFKDNNITVIMPGRSCALTKTKIKQYLLGLGKRYCKGFIKLGYVKKQGFSKLCFDLLLVAKRSYSLRDIAQDLDQKKNRFKYGKQAYFSSNRTDRIKEGY